MRGKLIAGATSAGAEVFNLVSFEDVIIRETTELLEEQSTGGLLQHNAVSAP